MTCHIAVSGPGFAALLSDSQGSTATSEFHGAQKQVPFGGWLLGVAGHGAIGAGALSATHADLADVRDWLRSTVTPQAQSQAAFISVAEGEAGVRQFMPGTFLDWGPGRWFGSIGSGSEFVDRAIRRDDRLGVFQRPRSLADAIVWLATYAEASDESLTVDDRYLLGIVASGRAYLCGDKSVALSAGPSELRNQWPAASNHFDLIKAAADMARGEQNQAYRSVADALQMGRLDQLTLSRISNAAASRGRQALRTALTDFMSWYDADVRASPGS